MRLLRTSAVGVVLAASLGTVPAAAGVTADATVVINAAKQYQRIAGFGVSEGFGQAKALMNAPASVQERALSLLYSPTHGAGLTILRNEICADAGFTIEPKAPSSPNATPSYLSPTEVDQDQGQLWFARRIKADYGVSDVFADAWSAPAFMKTTESAINGGTLCGARAHIAKLVTGARPTPTTSCGRRRTTPLRARRSPTLARSTSRRSHLPRTAWS